MSRLRALLAFGLLVAMGGSAVAQSRFVVAPAAPQDLSAYSTSDEVTAANMADAGCLYGAVKELDDHTSDAATIATAAVAQCSASRSRVIATDCKGQSDLYCRDLDAGLDAVRHAATIRTVLKLRAMQASPHPDG
jgi:hypothetical protein